MTGIDSPSRQVLDQTPGRALTFLRGVATSVAIRGLLGKAGYSAKEHALGFQLLGRVSRYPGADEGPKVKDEVSLAIAELDSWDEPGFARIHAATTRLHPEQAKFLFAGSLAATSGLGAVLAVSAMLDRLDALESAPERQATRQADQAALATLAERGITKAERSRLRDLCTKAQTYTPADASETDADAEADPNLLALYDWYRDWSTTARAVITRREHLLRLGLAKRKTPPKKSKSTPAAAAPGTSTPGTGTPPATP